MPPRGPLEIWLQHADCDAPATGAEVEVVSQGKIFMTRGWGEVARACRSEGALAIHFEYDGASTMFFKVFERKAAAWSVVQVGVVGMAQRPLASLLLAPPAAPPPAAAVLGSPATLPSPTRLRRQATTATCPGTCRS